MYVQDLKHGHICICTSISMFSVCYSNVYITGALNLTHEAFHSTVAPTVISSVGCVGTESSIGKCTYSTLTTCGPLSDAGVVCQGMNIKLFVYFLSFMFCIL